MAFERSLLYSFKREDLYNESIWETFSGLLQHSNLQTRKVLDKVVAREREIKDAMAQEEHLMEEYAGIMQALDSEIEEKEEEIEQLKDQKERQEKELRTKKSEIWEGLGLPLDLFGISPAFFGRKAIEEQDRRARKVVLQELVDTGLVKDGQILYLSNKGRRVANETVQIVARSNKLKYKDGNQYSPSDLAMQLLKKLKIIGSDRTTINGNLHWQTQEGKTLDDLNKQVRQNAYIDNEQLHNPMKGK